MIKGNSLKDNSQDNTSLIHDLSDTIVEGHTKEQVLFTDLKLIAQEVIELEKIKDEFAKIMIKNEDYLDFSDFMSFPTFYIKENFLKKKVNASNISGLNLVSVDGSSVVKKYMNMDFSFLKTIAVKYHFYKNTTASIEYYPDLSGYNNYRVQGNFLHEDDTAIDAKTSMEMRRMEVNLLNEMIRKDHEIDIIVIDGTILVMPINLIFSKDPEISLKYDALLKEFLRLYSNCQNQGILLIGSIKDTRTSALTNLLRDGIQLLKPSYSNLEDFTRGNYRQVMTYFSDIDLFNRILNQSERSCIFNCKREMDKIREEGIKKEIPYYFPLDFYAFYLKSAKNDTPSRIEFFVDENTNFGDASRKADLISSILLPIASLNDHYGLPIPQIEAHRRAVFKPSEINLLMNNLSRQLGKNGFELKEKRRNRRPF